ncbi:Hydrogen cyanide synthase subunit HcnA [Pandoraea terrae]|uniref:Hydrogen cyanide synthase subunit HcnA n=1 Tax=Pandoraea terrae TaxID=1537710 RepID=A0A5E4YIH6_9BURK|nr:(2Fe-2S)-binding protein [Pandoraea terrae]VVE48302.1 Hydrogen cyanide synthase subunit HcnA [Pandoraea terrae]
MFDDKTNPASATNLSSGAGQWLRLTETGRTPIRLEIDGVIVEAMTGDTLLTAILLHRKSVRRTEFTGAPRAGFCLMGACQDCWVRTVDGQALRACSTPASDGMRIRTAPRAEGAR